MTIMPRGFVYILTNKSHTTLYVGVTSDLFHRTLKHREKFYPNSFSARYNLYKLVYYEEFATMMEAIAREKQLKAGPRKQKIALINKYNPEWNDLFEMPPFNQTTHQA
jgi:putative endonuclease